VNIGFIGLGNMGSCMAANILKAGHSLTVYDLKHESTKPLLDAGARWADSPKILAAASDIVFTSLPGPEEVEEVALGQNGILEGIHHGATYIDVSTSSPALERRIYARFAEKGAGVMDVPVSGGPSGAKAATLVLMVGGDEEVFQQCLPVLKAIGNKITYTGKIGCGSICKLMHNCILYGMQTLTAECMTLGVKAGVEPKSLWRVLLDGAVGQGVLFKGLIPEIVFQEKFDPPSFSLRLAYKDVFLATSLGRETDVPMAMANLTLQEMMAAMNRGWGDRDSRIAVLLQEERAGGIKLRASKEELGKP
jgi:3-hydroxyisobutyrate dehydrogenase-like beta-hydroxyacid dehydrogenase